MGNLSRFRVVLFFSLVFLSSCGRSIPVAKLPPVKPVEKTAGEVLFGTFTTSDRVAVELEKVSGPIVLIFASETCITCVIETEVLVNLFKAKGSVPTNVSIYTVLIGAIHEDVVDWKDFFAVPWTAGIDPGDSMYRRYCPEGKTPCTIAFSPDNKNWVKFIGESSPEELQKETGTWLY